MGHEGSHAVMFSRDGHLEIRTWRRLGAADAADHIAASEMRPWARGFPRPAWIEAEDIAPLVTAARDGHAGRIVRR
jgi:hypothetical protein